MLLNKDHSCLLLIDVQEKLALKVQKAEDMLQRCQWLLQVANDLNVPCIVSEQYPKGLSHTVASLAQYANPVSSIEKVHFSCLRNATFQKSFNQLQKKQCVLIGIETHVCVLQTAIDLKTAGFDVFVVIDAVSSRYHQDHKYSLKRMQACGIQLVTSEMVLFEWLEQAGTPQFKTFSKKYLMPQSQG